MSAKSKLLVVGHPFYAGAFVWNVKREMGVVLDYGRATLSTAEKFFLKTVWRRTPAIGGISLPAATSAYLIQVILRNFGGKVVYDEQIGILMVEDVGGAKIKATPGPEVYNLYISRTPGMFEQYYDSISLAIETARKESVIDELLEAEETVLKPSAEAYVLLAKNSPEKLRLRPAISTFYWCPTCSKAGCAEIYSTRLHHKRISRFWIELLLKSLKKVRERTCLKCGGPVLPFGYSIGFISSVIMEEGSCAFFLMEDKEEEGLVTGYSTVLGRSLFTARRLHKDAKGRIVDAGEPKALSGIFTAPFPQLPDAIFCI